MSEPTRSRRDLIFATVSDLVSAFRSGLASALPPEVD